MIASVPTPEDMRELGAGLARLLRAGDLILLSGPLGAGKTALVQGIGAGLGVAGAITSPTFVIARVHRSPSGGPSLVHVDAYRLGSLAELDDLDLDADLEESITAVEWGSGVAEVLSDARLEVIITRADETEERRVELAAYGDTWLHRAPSLAAFAARRARPGPTHPRIRPG